jgi:choline dehydrogenase-like flavoprotein
MIPNEKSYIELDPTVKDKWGIPVARWNWHWSEHETNQCVHARNTFIEIIESMGGKAYAEPTKNGKSLIAQGGAMIHEVGGAIMGFDAKTSVCNQWSQTWDVPNLFLCDGSAFASNADKNPTLTIMALAWRCADHIIEESRKGTF